VSNKAGKEKLSAISDREERGCPTFMLKRIQETDVRTSDTKTTNTPLELVGGSCVFNLQSAVIYNEGPQF